MEDGVYEPAHMPTSVGYIDKKTAATDYKYMKFECELRGWPDTESRPKEINGPSSELVGVALFGVGRSGTIHFVNLYRNSRVDLVYCIDDNAKRLDFIKTKWQTERFGIKLLKSARTDEVLADSRVHAVVICTPTFTHEDLITRALKAGKAVFCEKPLSHDIKGTQLCYDMAEKAKLPLMCAFNRRFDPQFKNIKERVCKGEIGQVHTIKTCSRDSPCPTISYIKDSGGIFHDCMVHDIDLICWVLGERPVAISGVGHSFIKDVAELDDYDTVIMSMKFPSGALGSIELSRKAVYGYDQRLEVFGDKGMLDCRDSRPTSVVVHKETGSTSVPIYYSFPSLYHEAYIVELDHFLDAVQGKCTISVKSSETVDGNRIASACEEAVRTAKTVTLDWD